MAGGYVGVGCDSSPEARQLPLDSVLHSIDRRVGGDPL